MSDLFEYLKTKLSPEDCSDALSADYETGNPCSDYVSRIFKIQLFILILQSMVSLIALGTYMTIFVIIITNILIALFGETLNSRDAQCHQEPIYSSSLTSQNYYSLMSFQLVSE